MPYYYLLLTVDMEIQDEGVAVREDEEENEECEEERQAKEDGKDPNDEGHKIFHKHHTTRKKGMTVLPLLKHARKESFIMKFWGHIYKRLLNLVHN